MLKAVCLGLVLLQLQGCGLLQDRRDAAWDPPRQGQLFEQIPNEEGGAGRHCGDWSLGRVPRC
jgi:hypothetical protein